MIATTTAVTFKKGESVRYKGHMCYESTVFGVGENGLVTIETRYEPRGKLNYMSVSPEQLVRCPYKLKAKVKYRGDMSAIATVEEYTRDGKIKISYGHGPRLVVSIDDLVKA
jgi:hypothetical protein